MSRAFVPIVMLASALAACATPRDLDLSLRQPSAQGRYVVQIEPPVTAPAINQMHNWQIKLSSPDGAPVRNARIAVDGGMPQHGHGLPTRPQVTHEAVAGTYVLEGMKFSMTGWWEIKLSIQAADGADTVAFNTIVGASGPTR